MRDKNKRVYRHQKREGTCVTTLHALSRRSLRVKPRESKSDDLGKKTMLKPMVQDNKRAEKLTNSSKPRPCAMLVLLVLPGTIIMVLVSYFSRHE